jgi:hypothetical protein
MLQTRAPLSTGSRLAIPFRKVSKKVKLAMYTPAGTASLAADRLGTGSQLPDEPPEMPLPQEARTIFQGILCVFAVVALPLHRTEHRAPCRPGDGAEAASAAAGQPVGTSPCTESSRGTDRRGRVAFGFAVRAQISAALSTGTPSFLVAFYGIEKTPEC